MNNATEANINKTCQACNTTFFGVVMTNFTFGHIKLCLCPNCWATLSGDFTKKANKLAEQAIKNTSLFTGNNHV